MDNNIYNNYDSDSTIYDSDFDNEFEEIINNNNNNVNNINDLVQQIPNNLIQNH
jgi:hypothetical protein